MFSFGVGSVMQAARRTIFEDGLKIEIQFELRNDPQSAYTIPETNLVGLSGTSHYQGDYSLTFLKPL